MWPSLCQMGLYHLCSLVPTQEREMGTPAPGLCCSSSLGFGGLYACGGRRKEGLLFVCFYLGSIVLESDEQQALPLREWGLEQCVLFIWELIL